jgi:Zn-dependent metalloprotease
MCKVHNPIMCVIPPYMLDKMVENGSPQLRSQALRTIKQSEHIRTQRSLLQTQPRAEREALTNGIQSHSFERVLQIFSANQGETLPGTLVRKEGDQPTGDEAVDEAFDGGAATWSLYAEEYERNSIDDNGMVMNQTVHFGVKYNNAFWNGQQMIYGDGDGEIFSRFTIDIDIIAHELTHGVTQYEASLVYWYQSGALNESFSDVFGALVKQRHRGQEAKDADWLIGESVLIGDYALRSMKAPGTAYVNHPVIGTDPQPATMSNYKMMAPWDDNGGVHINSGIPNHAFYIAATELGGKAWEKAGLIWYRALRDRLGQYATFNRAADATIGLARELFGNGSLEEQAVRKAWKEVKVK